MNTSRHHYCRAMLSFLRERAQCLGAVANAPAAAEALNHFKNWSPPNQACLHVDLRALRCEWSRNMPLLGLPEACRKGQGLSLQALLSAIHPNFLNAYSVFAQAAYGPLPGGCPPHSGDYISLRLPLYQPSARRYTVVEQTSYPIALDAEGRLLSHVNAYVPLSEAFEEPFCVVPRSSRQAWTLALMKEARAQLLLFHTDEQALLRQYHLTPQAGIQAAAHALGCTADRVKNLNKRILGKARRHIGNFSNAKAVARYAERLGAEFLS